MTDRIILASASPTRARLLQNAAVPFAVAIPNVDEEAIRAALQAEQASPRDIADTLAELKAQRISFKHPDALVIGCDQVLALGAQIFAKPVSPQEAVAQLHLLRGKTHQLLSAAVIYQGGEPVWRHTGVTRLVMRDLSDTYLDDYVTRNWKSIQHAVGAYKLEEEGLRLFHKVDGDYFNVLGLPLFALLSYLTVRGTLPS